MTLREHGDIILNTMSQKREKWNPFVLGRAEFWMIWRSYGIPCFNFNFLFGNNGKREQLNENDVRHSYGIFFFENVILKHKVLSQRLRGTLTTAFEKHLTVEHFTNLNQHTCRACSSENISPRHLTYYCMLLFLSHKPSF